MNIHEYQAKAILHAFGAPVAKGVPVLDVDEIETAIDELPGPLWVVKSQIHAGGRGKGRFRESEAGTRGGVCLAHSKQEAVAHARAMFGHHLVTAQTSQDGKQVNRLYIEDGAGIDRELYLSLLVDRTSGQTAFVVSTEGGMNIEDVAHETPEKILTLPVADAVRTEDAEKLCTALALDGQARADGMALLPVLHRAFVDKDMSMLEINPLVVMKDGHLRVLDAKISFDDNALFRHPDIAALRDASEEDAKETEAAEWDLSYIALDGTIGCMVNGAGLAMATMDIIKLYGAEPANFCDVGGGASAEKVAAAFKIIMKDPAVKGILVNIFGGIMRCDVIAEGIIQAVKDVNLTAPLVVRLEGTNVDKGKAIIARSGLNVISADDLDDAARKIVAAVKGV